MSCSCSQILALSSPQRKKCRYHEGCCCPGWSWCQSWGPRCPSYYRSSPPDRVPPQGPGACSLGQLQGSLQRELLLETRPWERRETNCFPLKGNSIRDWVLPAPQGHAGVLIPCRGLQPQNKKPVLRTLGWALYGPPPRAVAASQGRESHHIDEESQP